MDQLSFRLGSALLQFFARTICFPFIDFLKTPKLWHGNMFSEAQESYLWVWEGGKPEVGRKTITSGLKNIWTSSPDYYLPKKII